MRPISLLVALAAFLLTGLATQPALAGHHEPVVNVVTVSVHDGKLDKYRKQVRKLNGVLERLGSSATLRVWNTTTGGPDTGTVLVVLEFPNAAAWAADSAKMQADEEWQKIVSDLPEIRTLESTSLWRDISPNPVQARAPGSGTVLAITGVAVHPGKLDTYRERISKAKAISDRLGLSGKVRMWRAEVAGPNTGGVAVGIEYPDLATYVAETGKLAMDREWQKLLSGLDGIRTLTGRWIYQEITP